MADKIPLDSRSRSMDDAVDAQRPWLSILPGPVRRDHNGAAVWRRSTEETSMQYALLIYGPEPTEAAPEDLMLAEYQEYGEFTRFLRERNAMLAGEALEPTSTATTVRVVEGKTLATDGPFAETKEALGGFYLVEAADLDEAIRFAAMIPGARRGSIEIRPVFTGSAGGSAAAGS
jgi:hypothetical protein